MILKVLKIARAREFSKSRVPVNHELYEKVLLFFVYSTFNKITFKFAAYASFPWKLNRYSCGVTVRVVKCDVTNI